MLPFVALKALSFLPFGGLLKGGSLKMVLIGVAVVAVAFGIWKWKDNIKTAVYNEIYAEQQEQIIEKQKRQIELTERLMKEREQAVAAALDAQAALKEAIAMNKMELRRQEHEAMQVPPVINAALDIIRKSRHLEGMGDKLPPDPEAGSAPSTGNSVIDRWNRLRGGES